MRQFKDLLEEKEFLEANISNLSVENTELRYVEYIAFYPQPRPQDFMAPEPLLRNTKLLYPAKSI